MAKHAPGVFCPGVAIWHAEDSKVGKSTKGHGGRIKDASSTGFYFRANSISCCVESKAAQLPFNNMPGSTARIPEDPGLRLEASVESSSWSQNPLRPSLPVYLEQPWIMPTQLY